MEESIVTFFGNNNILFFEEGVSLSNCIITFNGDNSVVFIRESKYPLRIVLDTFNDNVFYIGNNYNTTRRITAVLSERRHIIIGNDSLFSFGVWLRNSDPHIIYDAVTKKRLNQTKSIYIGDHVWIGQEALIAKGAKIGSGSIIGAKAFISDKRACSNSVFAGVPVEIKKQGVFWTKESVHGYTYKNTVRSQTFDTDRFIFERDENVISLNSVERGINELKTSQERFDFVYNALYKNDDKNRFYISPPRSKSEEEKKVVQNIPFKYKKDFYKGIIRQLQGISLTALFYY